MIMRIKLSLAGSVLMALMVLAYADEPPQWLTHFKITSANGLYIAKVTPADKNTTADPWDRTYQLQLYRVDKAKSRKLLWQQKYLHNGYSDGLRVSNDGRYVVDVSYWYVPKGPHVYLYSKEGIRTWDAKALSVPINGLPRTISHYLWLDDKKGWYFIQNKRGQTVGLRVYTLKGKREIIF